MTGLKILPASGLDWQRQRSARVRHRMREQIGAAAGSFSSGVVVVTAVVVVVQ